jgi:hypothetical protein
LHSYHITSSYGFDRCFTFISNEVGCKLLLEQIIELSLDLKRIGYSLTKMQYENFSSVPLSGVQKNEKKNYDNVNVLVPYTNHSAQNEEIHVFSSSPQFSFLQTSSNDSKSFITKPSKNNEWSDIERKISRHHTTQKEDKLNEELSKLELVEMRRPSNAFEREGIEKINLDVLIKIFYVYF